MENKVNDDNFDHYRLVDSSSEEISLEELQRVMSAINSVTSLTSGFPSSFLKLQQVRTPCVALSNSGKVGNTYTL